MLNIYYANLAGVNIGLITVIWRISIFMGAFSDYLIFGQKLKYYHYIGLILIFMCSVLIAFDHMPKEKAIVNGDSTTLWKA